MASSGTDWGDFLTITWSDNSARTRKECNKWGREKYWSYNLGYTLGGHHEDLEGLTHDDEKEDLEDHLGGDVTTTAIATLTTDQLQKYLHISIASLSEYTNTVTFWSMEYDDDGQRCALERSISVDKPGLDPMTEYTTESDEPFSAPEYTSALLISSLGDSVNIDDETGLITQGTFRIHWDNLNNREAWDDGTKHQFDAIEEFDVSGSIFLQKEVAEEGTTKFFSYSPINTGQNQTDPTFREVAHAMAPSAPTEVTPPSYLKNYLWGAGCGHLHYKEGGTEYSITPGEGTWHEDFVWDVEPFLSVHGILVYEYSHGGEWTGTVKVTIDKNAYTEDEQEEFWNECNDISTSVAEAVPTFDVFYGEVEENAIKDKYNDYNGNLSQYISDLLDKLVTKAVTGLNQSKSKYTFKRIDTNRKFKKINASAFAKDKRAEEPESVEASATRVEPMLSPPDSGVY